MFRGQPIIRGATYLTVGAKFPFPTGKLLKAFPPTSFPKTETENSVDPIGIISYADGFV